jgi:hypothetical protein
VFVYGLMARASRKPLARVPAYYLGADSELLFDAANPQGLLTTYVHRDVRRVGSAIEYLPKDVRGSVRLTLRNGGAVALQRHVYGPMVSPRPSAAQQPPPLWPMARPISTKDMTLKPGCNTSMRGITIVPQGRGQAAIR